MSLKKRIAEDFMTAFKARTEEGTKKKNILGLLKAEITKEEQSEGRTSGDLTDDEIMDLIKGSVKNANKSIEGAKSIGGKEDLIEESEFEISVYEAYLPKKMTEAEIDAKIKELSDGGANHIGKFMGGFKGLEVDMKLVKEKVAEILN